MQQQLLRIIPCLLLHRRGLYKTVRFKKPQYIGDPINAVRIFNEKEVDELLLVDIDATTSGKPPNVELVRDIVSEAFMPVGYGGGVTSIDQMESLFSAGVEKVSISAHALAHPEFISEAARSFGSQSVVVTVDVKKPFLSSRYALYTHNGARRWNIPLLDWVRKTEQLGAGEVILNNIDRDGTMDGYDHALLSEIAGAVSIPVIALGGASSYDDLERAILESKMSAAAAGSLFVYKAKGQGVLINYPERPDLKNFR